MFDEANALIQEIITHKLIIAKGVFGIFPAKSVGDDIEVYKDNEIFKFFSLRQQEVLATDSANLALSDFISPNHDYFGAFAITAGLNCDEIAHGYEKNNDDYKSIMIKAVADRLVEAFAEVLHKRIRTEYWGYVNESLTTEELIHEEYQGIRPAPGYPAQPDHSEKMTLWKLLDVEKNTGISLTESLAMYPAASISGLYIAHPLSKYFAVGQVCDDQIEDYASRKGITIDEVKQWI